MSMNNEGYVCLDVGQRLGRAGRLTDARWMGRAAVESDVSHLTRSGAFCTCVRLLYTQIRPHEHTRTCLGFGWC